MGEKVEACETVNTGWVYQTASGDFVSTVFNDEGDVVGYEAVPLDRCSWVSHDTFLRWRRDEEPAIEAALGPIKALPIKVTIRREVKL